jgi:hypothetical protein
MTKPLYFYNGTTFELVGPTTPQSPIAYQTSAPTGPATGDLWIDSDGDVDTYNRQLTRYYFIATAAQTTISGVDANGLTLAYVAGSEAVYVNGALQVRGQDYTATNGTSVVLSSGLAVNDVVEIFAYTAFTVANAYTKTETDGVAAAAPGLRLVVPTSVAVGSGTGSVDANGAVTFTTASSISLNGCFSSAYQNYVIKFNLTAATGTNTDLLLYGRISGTNTTVNYVSERIAQYSGTITGTETATGRFGAVHSGYPTFAQYDIEIKSPQLAQVTLWNSTGMIANSAGEPNQIRITGYHYDATTQFDGITLYPASGTFTGTVRVYGYKN